MKTSLFTALTLISSFAFGQVKELQSNSDKARGMIGKPEDTFNPNENVMPNPYLYVMPTIGTGGHVRLSQ
jgi:hypothetical protein